MNLNCLCIDLSFYIYRISYVRFQSWIQNFPGVGAPSSKGEGRQPNIFQKLYGSEEI